MGLFSKISFKGIGKAISKGVKTVTKQISIKNAIAVGDIATGGQVSNAVGVVTALTGMAQKEMDSGNTEQAVQIAQHATDIKEVANRIGGNPSIKELAAAGAGGALTAVGLALTGTQTVATQAANAADNVMLAWLKSRWYWIAGGIAIIWAGSKMMGNSKGGRR